MLALTGDTSDNIPGVPKVGQKTAAKWLNEFRDLEGIKSNADSIKGVVGENLRNSLNNLDRNVELVSLKNDVDIGVSFESLLQLNGNEETLDELFADLEFKKPKKKPANKEDKKVANVQEVTQNLAPSKPIGAYKTILNKKDLEEWSEKLDACKVFAIDTETDSLNTVSANLVGISLSVKEGEGCYIPLKHEYEGCPTQIDLELAVSIIGSSIEKNKHKAVGQNLKFDIPILARHGIALDTFHADTMLMSYVLNSTATRHGMDKLAEFYLNYTTVKYKEVTGTASKQINFSAVEIEVASNYAAEDADITLRLFNKLEDLLKDKPTQLKLLNDIEYPLVHVLSKIEQNGAKIDKDKLAEHSKELSEKIANLSTKINCKIKPTKYICKLAAPSAIPCENLSIMVPRRRAETIPLESPIRSQRIDAPNAIDNVAGNRSLSSVVTGKSF